MPAYCEKCGRPLTGVSSVHEDGRTETVPTCEVCGATYVGRPDMGWEMAEAADTASGPHTADTTAPETLIDDDEDGN